MLLVQLAPAANPRSRLRKSHARFKIILAEKISVLQNTWIAWRSLQLPPRTSWTARRVLQLRLRQTVLGFSVTTQATTTA